MELSRRLQAVADLVTAQDTIADIGTDHAYIPIYLIEQGIVPSAVAMDVNRGPLERAAEHVMEHGFSDKISLRLSDGMEKLKAEEVRTAVLAGMGGGLMCRILREHWDITLSLNECILQPQSEAAKVRAFLLEEGFLFIQEDMVYEEGKYYPMMKVSVPKKAGNTGHALKSMITEPKASAWSKTEIKYGRLLLLQKHPVLKSFLEKEYALKSEILKNLEKQGGTKAKARIAELMEELQFIRKGMDYYAL